MATVNYLVQDLVSSNIGITPEGFVVCRNAVLARSAEHVPLVYFGREMQIGDVLPDQQYLVYRRKAELLNKRLWASLEGRPLTQRHPPKMLDSNSAGWALRGHCQNVHRGEDTEDGEATIVGDLIIHDAGLADLVLSGRLREVSLGYRCNYDRRPDGSWEQVDLLANHVALVDVGRNGGAVRVIDGKGEAMLRVKPEEKSRMQRDGEFTEQLTRKNTPPGSFAQQLRDRSQSYREYEAMTEAAAAFSEEAKRVGKEIAARTTPHMMQGRGPAQGPER